MVNIILFKSSICVALIHIYYYLNYQVNSKILQINIVLGLLLSILNHGLTFDIIKKIDRNFMKIGFLINYYLLSNIDLDIVFIYKIILINAVFLYYFSKYLEHTKKYTNIIIVIPHILSHLCITLVNIFLIISFV